MGCCRKGGRFGMADYLKERLTSLPQEILERFGDSSDIVVPSEVEAVFKEILDFIIACGVRYQLKNDHNLRVI